LGVKRSKIKAIRRDKDSDWDITQYAPNVHEIIFSNIHAGWEGWVLLSSDRHHDNKLSVWELERKHLDLALQRKALVIDSGDLFCAMQGKYDKRSNLDQVRPEHRYNDYLNRLTQSACATIV
jgi:hypothetical protein